MEDLLIEVVEIERDDAFVSEAPVLVYLRCDRLADLKDAVVDALATNDASAREVAVVGLNVLLDAGHMFGHPNAEILADVVNQVVEQFGEHPMAEALIKRTRRNQWVN